MNIYYSMSTNLRKFISKWEHRLIDERTKSNLEITAQSFHPLHCIRIIIIIHMIKYILAGLNEVIMVR